MFWLVLVIVVGVSVGHLSALASAVEGGNSARIGLDYRAFVAAGKLLWTGQGTYIYLPDSIPFLELARVGFVYPPWAAVFMVPWSTLPFGLGLTLWTISGLVVMVVGLRWCGVRDWRPIGYTLVTFPAVFALGLGQSTFWFVGVVALSVGAMQRQRGHLSGATLGIATWKPHLLGGFALLWIAHPRRHSKQIVSFTVTSLLLLVISAILIPGSWVAWFSLIFDSVNGLASAELEASLPGMIALLAGSLTSLRWVALIAFAIVLVPATVIVLRRGSGALASRLALVFAVSLLLVPHVVVYDVLLLLIPLGLALQSHLRRDAIAIGSLLALGLSVGPWLTRVQLVAWGRAFDFSTASVAVAALLFAFWVLRDEPFFVSPEHDDAIELGGSGVLTAETR